MWAKPLAHFVTYSDSNYQPYGWTKLITCKQTDFILYKISAPLMPSFAVAHVLLFTTGGFGTKCLLIHIISFNRKFNYTTKFFSELFPLGHWDVATVTPVSEHIPSYSSTQTSEWDAQQMHAADNLTKSTSQDFCLIFWHFFPIILKKIHFETWLPLSNFSQRFRSCWRRMYWQGRSDVQWISRLKCHFPLFSTPIYLNW